MAIYNGQLARAVNPTLTIAIQKINSSFAVASAASKNKDATGLLFLKIEKTGERDKLNYLKKIQILPVKIVKTRQSSKPQPIKNLDVFEQAVYAALEKSPRIGFDKSNYELYILDKDEQKPKRIIQTKSQIEAAKNRPESEAETPKEDVKKTTKSTKKK